LESASFCQIQPTCRYVDRNSIGIGRGDIFDPPVSFSTGTERGSTLYSHSLFTASISEESSIGISALRIERKQIDISEFERAGGRSEDEATPMDLAPARRADFDSAFAFWEQPRKARGRKMRRGGVVASIDLHDRWRL
jgi:hypothetical protein